MSQRRGRSYSEFVHQVGTDLTVVVYAQPTGKRGTYTLLAQVLSQPKGQGTTIVGHDVVQGTVVKDTAYPTPKEWVSTFAIDGSDKSITTYSPALSSALYAVGDAVGARYATKTSQEA